MSRLAQLARAAFGISAAAALLCVCGGASANITYNVSVGSLLSGTVTTDGTTGSLVASNIIAFDLTADLTAVGIASHYTLDSTVAGTRFSCSLFYGCGMTATSTTLSAVGGSHTQATFSDTHNSVVLSDGGSSQFEVYFSVPNADAFDQFVNKPFQFGTVGGTGTVPEPATLALLSLGLAGLGFARRKSH